MWFSRRVEEKGSAKQITSLEEASSSTDESADPVIALLRYRNKKPRDADDVWMQSKLDTWFRSKGELSLEQSFGVTYGRLCRFQRDQCLREAASLIGADRISTLSEKLEAEWNRFISRGPWETWRSEPAPPPDAARLHIALFWATRYNESQSLTAGHIARILSKFSAGNADN